VRQTTIRLPDELDAAITHEAARAGISRSEFMRLAIAHHLGWISGLRGDTPAPPPPDPQRPPGDA
jgi:hypothetical protein